MLAALTDIFLCNVSWTAIPASDTLTIGSQTAQGGAGILGYGMVADVVPMVGTASIGVNSPVPILENGASGIVGTAYSNTLTAQGGTAAYAFAVTAGALPTGLALNGSTGVISGTPTAAGTFGFTVQVTDANEYSGSYQFQITVSAPGGGAANYCVVS